MQRQPIVLDNGSGSVKVGFGHDLDSLVTFPAVMANSDNPTYPKRVEHDTIALGEDPTALAACPEPNKWEYVEKLWHYAFFTKLGVDPIEHPVMTTLAPFRWRDKEKMAEILFETFAVPAMFVYAPQVLALYHSGLVTGFVLDCGASHSCSCSIYEGYVLPHSILHVSNAGFHVTQYLASMLSGSLTGSQALHTTDVKEVKEQLCYVAQDFESEMNKHSSTPAFLTKEYKTSLGSNIKLDYERIYCPESLFQPSFNGKEYYGVHEMVYNSIMKGDVDIRKELYGNIVAAGGSTKFPGFPERLQTELTALAPSQYKVNVIAPENRELSAWRGGAVVSTLMPDEFWVPAKDYSENGVFAINTRCF